MKTTKIKTYFAISFSLICFFVTDQLLKLYFLKNPAKVLGGDFFFAEGEPASGGSGLLSFSFAKNYGVAFGFGLSDVLLYILIAVALVVISYTLWRAYACGDVVRVAALGAIFVGALSNVIDRFSYGFVVDYIDLKYFTVFNIADSLITVGVVVLLFGMLRESSLVKRKSGV